MKKLIQNLAITLLLLSPGITWAQITWTIPTTIGTPNVGKIGFVQGPSNDSRQQLLLADLAYATGGSMNPGEVTFAASCDTGGTSDTTHWFNNNNVSGSFPYTANQLTNGGTNPAQYIAMDQSTGAILGQGVITANSSNSSTGMQFTLSNALTRACTSSSNPDFSSDQLYVRWQPTPGSILPNNFNTNVSTSITFETTDLPSVTGAVQAYSIPSGQQTNYNIDAGENFVTDPAGNHNQIGLNLNGVYVLDFYEKCVTTGCSIPWSITRNGAIPTTSGSSSGTDTPGTTWTHVTHTMTLNESNTHNIYNAVLNVGASTSTAYVWRIRFIEQSQYAGNNTVFRDAYYKHLKALNLPVLRVMYPPMWGSSLTNYIKPDGQTSFASSGGGSSTGAGKLLFQNTYSIQDSLNLCYSLGVANCWITLPKLLLTSSLGSAFSGINEGTALSTFMSESCTISGCPGTSGQSWNSMNVAAGMVVHFELGNEGWNTGAGVNFAPSNGYSYGYVMGPFVHQFKTDANYNSNNKLIQNQNGDESGPGQYPANSFSKMGCTSISATPTYCPDEVAGAFYRMTQWNDLTNSIINGNVGEIQYQQTRSYTPANCSSSQGSHSWMFGAAYNLTCFGMATGVYESQTNPQAGSASPTQLQVNQQFDSVGGGLGTIAGALAFMREDAMTGPINVFAESDYGYSSYNFSTPYYNGWNQNTAIPDGPGQVNSQDSSIDLPELVGIRQLNTDIGSNTNLITSDTTSGIPVIASYAGTSNDSVPAQSNVVLVRPVAFINSAKTAMTLAITNLDPANSYTINTAGAGALQGTVTYRVFGGSAANCTANNNTVYYQGPNSPSVVDATTQTLSGTTLTIPACSMMTVKYSLSGTPTAAAPTFSPVAGAYGPAQTVTISSTTPSPSIYYCTTGPCTSGGTLYTAPVSVTSSETLYAYTTASGYTQSSTSSAAYTINGAAATPTFSPIAGTYSSAQTVGISSATSGATILYCIGVSCTPSTTYTGALTVSSSESISAIATETGFSNSATGTAAYTINLTASAPVFTPGPSTYTSPQTVTLTSSTSGVTFCSTVDGSTPVGTAGSCSHGTSGSTVSVAASLTLKSLASKSGYTSSSVTSGVYTITSCTNYIVTIGTNAAMASSVPITVCH